jgi:hypothetical protein
MKIDTKEQIKKKIFVTSLMLTILIFVIGILMSYVLDFYRVDEISRTIEEHEIDKEAYYLEQEFMATIGADKCGVMNQRFNDLKMDMHKVGSALTSYWSKSFFKSTDFDYLKRHYFLLELEFMTLIKKLNKECGTDYITIMFFYEKDDSDSITQGYILEDLSKAHPNNVVVLSLDKDYEDEPLVPVLVKRHNITKSPTLIINNIKIEEFQYGGQINATIREIIRNSTTDKYAKKYNFDSLFNSIGINKSDYIMEMMNTLKNVDTSNDSLTKAELRFMIGRLTENVSMMCESLQYYDLAASETNDEELKALIYESTVAVGCGRNKKAFLELAARSWEKTGNINRANIDLALVKNKVLPIEFNTSIVESTNIKANKEAKHLIIGNSGFEITKEDLIISQTDRVTRDWLGMQIQQPYSNNILRTFSERLKYNKNELREDIGWHEGARIELLKESGANNKIATGTIVIKKNEKWYAPNEDGIFMFEVPLDKILYPTTRFLKEDIAIIIDTHGVNTIVEQSIRNNASVVIGCCDHPDKIKAALYLSKKGKKVICFPDKYGYLALGKESNIYTSPTIRIIDNGEDKKAQIGKRPIIIKTDEKIIVVNATNNPYALWYYQTPSNYFNELSKSFDLNIAYVTMNDFNQMDKIVDAARLHNSKVIAARVFSYEDYEALKLWLESSYENRVILFHSMPYPYGFLLLEEFPQQTTFGDINPIFK